jgi:PPOX class probable F420-dependent enzyme
MAGPRSNDADARRPDVPASRDTGRWFGEWWLADTDGMRIPHLGIDAATEDRLRNERILWLSTTSPDGAPHIVPVWFLWDGSAFLVFSKPHAVKVRHMASEPRVAVALGEAEDDFDVQLVAARARLLDQPTREILPPAMLHKYRRQMAEIGLDEATFAETYSQAIRIVPTRFKPWRGRSWLDGRSREVPLEEPGDGAPRTLVPAWA